MIDSVIAGSMNVVVVPESGASVDGGGGSVAGGAWVVSGAAVVGAS